VVIGKSNEVGYEMKPIRRRGAFLDRDGVLNHDHGYIYEWKDFDVIDGVYDGLRALQDLRYDLIVITNQSGIARGLFTEVDFNILTKKMTDHFRKYQIYFSGVYHCPHYEQGVVNRYSISCKCRKPRPKMIMDAAVDLNIDLQESILIGDKASDIQAGINAGIRDLFYVGEQQLIGCQTVNSLVECAKILTTKNANGKRIN
jgi:D-glycero-D-manno-heptose 1,7-bisphosphate phosphatase